MVRADLLDCVDKFLRLNGRAKTTFWGRADDFYRRPLSAPARCYRPGKGNIQNTLSQSLFFQCQCNGKLDLEFVELDKVYRQKDAEFIRLLNAIRNSTVTDADLALFNHRCDPILSARRILLFFADQH